jgi:hypothetical protein
MPSISREDDAAASRLARAWSLVRRRDPHASAADRCSASGWHLSSGCSDGGVAVCPLCGRHVPTFRSAEIPRGVEVLQQHCA